jgi:hypothetical protein
MNGGLWATNVTQCPEADHPGHDEVNGNEIIEKTWKYEDKNPDDERDEG